MRPFHDLYTIGMNNYETRKPAKPENAAGRAVLAMVLMPVLERNGRAQIAAPPYTEGVSIRVSLLHSPLISLPTPFVV